MNKPESKVSRIIIGITSVTGLILVFIFQRLDVASYLDVADQPIYRFLINRTIRFFLNDIFALGLIFALFYEKRFVIFSFWVQIAGVVLFLIPYFILKLYFPSYNGPLLSFLHRLILNPILLLLLIPAFYHQQKVKLK
jgi:exosortase F-associated protein